MSVSFLHIIVSFAVISLCSSKASDVSLPIPFGTRVPVELVRVPDGDTIVVRNIDHNIKGTLSVRFQFIDCPESKQKHGKEATEYLRNFLSTNHKLSLTFDSVDMYGRALGVVYKGRNNVNKLLVENGHAWCYMNRCPPNYMKVLETAKERKLGLWSDANPQAPWEYRKEVKNKRKKKEL